MSELGIFFMFLKVKRRNLEFFFVLPKLPIKTIAEEKAHHIYTGLLAYVCRGKSFAQVPST